MTAGARHRRLRRRHRRHDRSRPRGEFAQLALNGDTGADGHAALIVFRMREWHAQDDADLPDDERDVLEIETMSGSGDAGPVDAIIADVRNGAIALHVDDDAASPGESSLEPLTCFAGRPE